MNLSETYVLGPHEKASGYVACVLEVVWDDEPASLRSVLSGGGLRWLS